MPNNFQVRVLGSFTERQAQIESVKFAMGVANMVVYQHDEQNRVHCHVYMFDAVYKIDKLRAECRRFFTGNSDFSCKAKAGRGDGKEITLEGCVQYGSKGGKIHACHVEGFDMAAVVMLENESRKVKVAVKTPYYQDLISRFYDANETLYEDLQEVARTFPEEMYAQYNRLKQVAKDFAFFSNGSIWTPKAAMDYKCIVNTICMRHGIAVNRADKIVDI